MHSKGSVTRAIVSGPRSEPEDRSTVFYFDKPKLNLKGHLLATMEGHGGNKIAELCKRKIERVFSLALLDADHIQETLQRVISELHEETKHLSEGASLSIACILESQAKVTPAILGHLPIIVIDEDNKVNVSPIHNVRTNLKERRAARNRGGLYKKCAIWKHGTSCGLKFSRALGNAAMGNVISHEPEIYMIERPKLVLTATRGFLDLSSCDSKKRLEVIVGIMLSGGDAQTLMRWANIREGGLESNATVILWKKEEVN